VWRGGAPAQRQTSPDRPQLGDEVRDYKRLMTGDNIIEIEKYTRCLSNEQRANCEINSSSRKLIKFIILLACRNTNIQNKLTMHLLVARLCWELSPTKNHTFLVSTLRLSYQRCCQRSKGS
jgi:hypothetical protein